MDNNNTSSTVTSGLTSGVAGTSQRLRRAQDTSCVVGSSQQSSTSTLLHSDSNNSDEHGVKSHRKRNLWQHLGLMMINRRWGSLLFVSIIIVAGTIFLFSLFIAPQSQVQTGASKTAQKNLKGNNSIAYEERSQQTSTSNGISQNSNSLPTASEKKIHQRLPIAKPFEPTQINMKYGLFLLTGSIVSKSRSNTVGVAPGNLYYPAIDLSTIISKEEAMKFLMGFAGGYVMEGDVTPNDEEEVSIPSATTHITQQGSFANKASIRKDLAVLTRRGYKGGLPQAQVNQDRLVIQTSFGGKSSNDFFMGLFDGHGDNGHKVAHFAHLEMAKILENEIGKSNKHHEYYDEATMKQILEYAFVEIDRTVPDLSGSGCTAHTILRLGDTIYASNAGDSRILIAYYIPSLRVTSVIYRNELHKPDTPGEKTRIESKGGIVLDPPPNFRLATSRVLVIIGTTQIGLAMSRSIGDHEARNAGVIANPVTDVIHISEEVERIQKLHGLKSKDDIKLFAVAGSDGIMELLPEQRIISEISQGLFAPSTSKFANNPEKSLLDTIQDLIMSASAEWMSMQQPYRDDISLAAIEIKT